MKEWLSRLEQEKKIEILFSCEAGSRAWGTATEESDYDIRFVYKYLDTRSYLSVIPQDDVIDQSAPFDAHGWDIMKMMQLFRKSNPSLYEWAFSPIVYINRQNFVTQLKEMILTYYSPYSLVMHYVSLITRNIKDLFSFNSFNPKDQKRLLQALKATLIIKKIIKEKVVVAPMFVLGGKGNQEDLLMDYYTLLVQAKKANDCISSELGKTILTHLSNEKESMINHSVHLPKGQDATEALNKWLWDIFQI